MGAALLTAAGDQVVGLRLWRADCIRGARLAAAARRSTGGNVFPLSSAWAMIALAQRPSLTSAAQFDPHRCRKCAHSLASSG